MKRIGTFEDKAWRNKALTLILLFSVLFFPISRAEPFTEDDGPQSTGKVLTASLSGMISAHTEAFVKKVVAQAEEQKAGLIVFTLDASGGSLDAAHDIAEAIDASKIPVAVWIPPGGRMTPAGAFVVQAAHIAAMASDVRFGALSPLTPSGLEREDEAAKQKSLETLTAELRSLARFRGRNAEAVPLLFDESRAYVSEKALEEGLIDLITDTSEALILFCSGRRVDVGGRVLRVEASVDDLEEIAIPVPVLTGKVVFSSLSGTVGVQMEEFVKKVVAHAETERAGLIVFSLDTPGGLVEATRGIIRTMLNSKVPVAMWVPTGARAASAGAFMMQAAHIAAMAKGSNIGAAHPGQISGSDIDSGDIKQKLVNDLVAQMRSLAQMRGRNEQVARQMVEESLSLPARDALAEGVIDFMAGSLEELLENAQGRVVDVDGRMTSVGASTDMIDTVEMSIQERLIHFLSDPGIAYLLLVGGLLAIFYEIVTPGGFVLGVTGAVMLLLGSIGLKMLPFNWAGVALVGAGVIIMGIDLLVGGMGILSLLGVAVLIAGGLFLFHAPGGEMLHVSMSVIAGMAITLGLCFTLFALMIVKSLRSKVVTGQQSMVGLDVEVVEPLDPDGLVRCRGELWKARTEARPLTAGAAAVVLAMEGLVLIVGPKQAPESEEPRS